MTDNKDRIILYWKKDASGRYFLSPGGKTGRLDGPELEVVIKMSEEETENQMTRTTQTTRTIRAARTKTVVSEDRGSGGNGPEARVFRVFQQKAGTYGAYSEYMTRHGCACCSLTTLLAAYVPQYLDLRPDETIARVEREHFDEKVWQKNYSRHIARQMPVPSMAFPGFLRIIRCRTGMWEPLRMTRPWKRLARIFVPAGRWWWRPAV